MVHLSFSNIQPFPISNIKDPKNMRMLLYINGNLGHVTLEEMLALVRALPVATKEDIESGIKSNKLISLDNVGTAAFKDVDYFVTKDNSGNVLLKTDVGELAFLDTITVDHIEAGNMEHGSYLTIDGWQPINLDEVKEGKKHLFLTSEERNKINENSKCCTTITDKIGTIETTVTDLKNGSSELHNRVGLLENDQTHPTPVSYTHLTLPTILRV